MEVRGFRGTPDGKGSQTQVPRLSPTPYLDQKGETEAHQRENWQPTSLGSRVSNLLALRG